MLMCGVGAKSVAQLMKYYMLQSEVVKVKFLMNSNMTLTVLNLHQKTDPKVQQDFKGQGHYSKVKGQTMVRPTTDVAHLHPLTNVPTMYKLPTPYGFRDIARTRFYRAARPTAHPDSMGENNTLTALKGCGVIKRINLLIPTI